MITTQLLCVKVLNGFGSTQSNRKQRPTTCHFMSSVPEILQSYACAFTALQAGHRSATACCEKWRNKHACLQAMQKPSGCHHPRREDEAPPNTSTPAADRHQHTNTASSLQQQALALPQACLRRLRLMAYELLASGSGSLLSSHTSNTPARAPPRCAICPTCTGWNSQAAAAAALT